MLFSLIYYFDVFSIYWKTSNQINRQSVFFKWKRKSQTLNAKSNAIRIDFYNHTVRAFFSYRCIGTDSQSAVCRVPVDQTQSKKKDDDRDRSCCDAFKIDSAQIQLN